MAKLREDGVIDDAEKAAFRDEWQTISHDGYFGPATAQMRLLDNGMLPDGTPIRLPDYKAPPSAPFTAEEVSVQTGEGDTLHGTLLLPKTPGPHPVVVLVSGTSPNKRDMPMRSVGSIEEYRSFRELAELMASQGIAVLRYDDAGAGESTSHKDWRDRTAADEANDLGSLVAMLRARPDIQKDKVALV